MLHRDEHGWMRGCGIRETGAQLAHADDDPRGILCVMSLVDDRRAPDSRDSEKCAAPAAMDVDYTADRPSCGPSMGRYLDDYWLGKPLDGETRKIDDHRTRTSRVPRVRSVPEVRCWAEINSNE